MLVIWSIIRIQTTGNMNMFQSDSLKCRALWWCMHRTHWQLGILGQHDIIEPPGVGWLLYMDLSTSPGFVNGQTMMVSEDSFGFLVKLTLTVMQIHDLWLSRTVAQPSEAMIFQGPSAWHRIWWKLHACYRKASTFVWRLWFSIICTIRRDSSEHLSTY